MVKGYPSKRRRLVDPYTNKVVAAITSITGRERSSMDHSVQWAIESRSPGPLGAWEQHTISMDRQVRSDKGTSLRWRDRARGDATRTMRAALRDAAGKEVLSAWTTHTSRKLGTSFRPLGTKMRGSFEGDSRTLAPLSAPIVALTFHLILNHGHAPQIGVFVVEGSGGG
jgi:hypothetical protein